MKRYYSILSIMITLLLVAPVAAEDTLTFSSGAGAMSGAVDIAINKGFIQGETTRMHYFKNGNQSLKAFLDGKVDVGTTAPNNIITAKGFDPRKHVIIGTISYSDSQHRLLVRKDAHIKHLSDLKGKTIATGGTYAYYHLYKYLLHNGIECADVNINQMKKNKAPGAIASGKVQAVFFHGKPIEQSKKALGENNWDIYKPQNLARKMNLLIVNREMVKKEPQRVENMLLGIMQAEDFIKTNRADSIAILAKAKKYKPSKMKEAMSDITYELRLDQSLLLGMETLETWAIDNKIVSRTKPIDYFDYIDPAPLKKVAPTIVTLVH